MKNEAELIDELKKSHAEAKAQGYAALRKWGKDNRRRIRRLRRISEKTTKGLSDLIGCSCVVFKYDERKKRSRKTRPPRQPSSQPAPGKPETEKFGLEFWQKLIATGKIGEVMAAALKNLFDQISRLNEEIAGLEEQVAQLTKERDECRRGIVEARKQLANHDEVVRQRDNLLAKSAARAMIQHSEKSLNDGA